MRQELLGALGLGTEGNEPGDSMRLVPNGGRKLGARNLAVDPKKSRRPSQKTADRLGDPDLICCAKPT